MSQPSSVNIQRELKQTQTMRKRMIFTTPSTPITLGHLPTVSLEVMGVGMEDIVPRPEEGWVPNGPVIFQIIINTTHTRARPSTTTPTQGRQRPTEVTARGQASTVRAGAGARTSGGTSPATCTSGPCGSEEEEEEGAEGGGGGGGGGRAGDGGYGGGTPGPRTITTTSTNKTSEISSKTRALFTTTTTTNPIAVGMATRGMATGCERQGFQGNSSSRVTRRNAVATPMRRNSTTGTRPPNPISYKVGYGLSYSPYARQAPGGYDPNRDGKLRVNSVLLSQLPYEFIHQH